MTDLDIATRVRALAADRANPLSVTCDACKAMPGAPCVDRTDLRAYFTEDGCHVLRGVDAQRAADRNAAVLLNQVASAPPT